MPITIYRNIRRNISEDGLIISSSGFLVNTMLNRIDFSNPQRILEIGSGKGAFTREIVRRMPHGSELHVTDIKAEYNPLIEKLIAEHPLKSIILYNRCVTEMPINPGSYDVIVSSLPLKNFENRNDGNAFLHKVIRTLHYSLRDGGMYLQYQYFRSNKADIEMIFGKTMDNVKYVPLNILPAFVYSMTK